MASVESLFMQNQSANLRIERFDLECGAVLLVERLSTVRSAGMTWLIPVGSACDADDRQGTSTVLSEWVWRGAGGLDAKGHSDALDRLGVQRGSSTESQHLRIGATMMGSRMMEALPLIADAVMRPTLSDATFEPVVEWALQGLSGLKDDPQQRAMILLREAHFPEPLNRSGLGQEQALRRIRAGEARELWAARARPQGSIIGLAGDVDGRAAAEALNRLLSGWSGRAEIIQPARERQPGSTVHETEATAQVHIGVAHAAPPETHADSILERYVVNVLSGGMSGRLFTEVREKRGLCYSVHASYVAGRTLGAVMAYSGTTPQRAQETLDVMAEEFRKMSRGVTREEFERARVGMKSRLVMQGESSAARASAVAHDQYVHGRPRTLEEMIAEVEAVRLEQVNEYLSRRALGAMTMATIGPDALKAPGA